MDLLFRVMGEWGLPGLQKMEGPAVEFSSSAICQCLIGPVPQQGIAERVKDVSVNLREFEDFGLAEPLKTGIEVLFFFLRTEGEEALACKRLSQNGGLSQKESVFPC
jgi:hypothetical protein